MHVLEGLGDLLRRTLSQQRQLTTSLAEEIEFARAYLDIEAVRFADRLVVAWDVDANALDARMPALLLQPLVENAVHHGIAKLARGGRIEVAARRSQDRVVVIIANDGPQLPNVLPNGNRIGLRNTTDRLGVAFGDSFKFELVNEGARVVVRLDLPYETA
jgi:LytS/YehU family sensor histidine kinase